MLAPLTEFISFTPDQLIPHTMINVQFFLYPCVHVSDPQAVIGCPHTDAYESLTSLVSDVATLLGKQITDTKGPAAASSAPSSAASSQGGDPLVSSGSGSDPRVYALEQARAGLQDLSGFVAAGALLAKHGLPLTVRHVSNCGHGEASRCVRQLLGRVQRCVFDRVWCIAHSA